MRVSTAVKYGVLAGLVAVVVIGVGGYAYLSSTGALTKTQTLDRAVVVFSSAAEDGAQVAQVVALLTDGGAKIEFVDPTATATIPGTSYTKLADAYPFGGARGVADALAGRAGGRVAYVDVPESAWTSVLASQVGTGGIGVVLPQSSEVFDGTRLVSFRSGENRVSPADVPHLMQGVAYLGGTARMAVTTQVGVVSLRALGVAAPADAEMLGTDLSKRAYTRLREALAQL
jgi:hypothetical protein